MLRCADGSYYVGSTAKDVAERLWEHEEGIGAVYTRERRPLALVWSALFDDLRDAQSMEWRVKRWNRKKKEALIADDWDRVRYWAKRPNARLPSRAAARPPQADAPINAELRASKGRGAGKSSLR